MVSPPPGIELAPKFKLAKKGQNFLRALRAPESSDMYWFWAISIFGFQVLRYMKMAILSIKMSNFSKFSALRAE